MAEFSQQTRELFAQIGTRLTAARDARGYTIQELSSETRINLLFLKKIEAGDLEGMPGIAFIKGFIRNYISVLEINDPDLEEELRRLGPQTAPEVAAELTPSNPQVLDIEVTRVPYVRVGLFVALAVLILWVGYVVFKGGDRPQEAAAPQSEQQGAPTAGQSQAPTGEPRPAPSVTTDGSPPPGAAPSATNPGSTAPAAGTAPAPGASPASSDSAGSAPATGVPPAAQTPSTRSPGAAARAGAPVDGRQRLELTVRGLEQTWLRLSIDRAPPIDVLLQPAETVAWEATQEIRLSIGKSHGVAVYLNGEEILLPQEPNRLIPNLVLNKLTLLRLEN